MTDLTPAQELRAAAERLRAAATASSTDAPAPWRIFPRHVTDPTGVCALWDAQRPILHGSSGTHGRGPFVTGPVGRYITLMHPGVGTALADWLDDAAAGDDYGEHDPYALAVARAILGSPQ